jgi:transcriptional regulator with XRE-family HTH domain
MKTGALNMPARKEPDATTYAGRFAVRLRTLREKAKLSVEELAEKMNVTPTTIYDWESTKSAPKIAILQKLAESLGISVRTLLPSK